MISTERLAEIFVDAADTLVDDFDVIEFLETLTNNTAKVSSANSAGLLLTNPQGQLQYVASSSESIKLLELFQLQYREGPCLDCFHSGEAVVNADLGDAEDRWPNFAPRAVAAGFRSVHAFPLRHQRKVIGAMNLFSTDTGGLEAQDARVVQSLADIATIALLQERTIRSGEILAEQLQKALNSRIMIEQAKGALARIHGVDVNLAFELMRRYARTNHLRLVEVAQGVLDDPDKHPELTRPSKG
ncbi:GAF and ANTAR domain-containing protein [Pedococcus bigeumensis]|uniref:GAF and ANTAR domain-containing protein n=1 Tax=Pedococcus bigeumensis TaxID=433644 RepID=UPI002FE98948